VKLTYGDLCAQGTLSNGRSIYYNMTSRPPNYAGKSNDESRFSGRCPTAAQMDAYCRLVLEGKSDEEIRNALRMQPGQYKTAQAFFLFHFREQMKERYLSKDLTAIPPLTDGMRERFLDCMRAGVAIPRVASMLGIPLPIITDYWFKDEEFKIEVDNAVEWSHVAVEKALYKRAVGFEHGSQTVSETRVEGLDGENRPTSSTTKTTNTATKIVYGDIGAQKFFLTNREPERWRLDGETGVRNTKGRILETLDEITKADEDELKGFDEESTF